MIHIIMLVLRIGHVISLHVENEDVVAEQASLTIEYVIHFGLLFESLELELLG